MTQKSKKQGPKAEVKPAETFQHTANFEYLHSEEGKFSIMEFHVYSNSKIPDNLQEVLQNPQDHKIMLVGKDGKESEVTDFVAQNYANMEGMDKALKKEPKAEGGGFEPKFKAGEAGPKAEGKPGKWNLIKPEESGKGIIEESPYGEKEFKPKFKGTGKEKPAEEKPGKWNLIKPEESGKSKIDEKNPYGKTAPKPAEEKGKAKKTEEKKAEGGLAKSKKKKKGIIEESPYG